MLDSNTNKCLLKEQTLDSNKCPKEYIYLYQTCITTNQKSLFDSLNLNDLNFKSIYIVNSVTKTEKVNTDIINETKKNILLCLFKRNISSCNYVYNLCAIEFYNFSNMFCNLYLAILNNLNISINTSNNVSAINYISNQKVLNNFVFPIIKSSVWSSYDTSITEQIYVKYFDKNGKFLYLRKLSSDFHFCISINYIFFFFFKSSFNCVLSNSELQYYSPLFFEIYFKGSNEKFIPVPILLSKTNIDLSVLDPNDLSLFVSSYRLSWIENYISLNNNGFIKFISYFGIYTYFNQNNEFTILATGTLNSVEINSNSKSQYNNI